MINSLINFYKKPRLIIIDLILINLALIISFYIRFDDNWLFYIKYSYFIVITLISFAVLYFSGIYNKMWQYASIGELSSIIRAAIFINLLFVIYVYFFQVSFPRSILIVNTVFDIFLLGGLRFILRILKEFLINKSSIIANTKVLLIGAGDAAELIIREMGKHPEMGKEIVGLIDDDQHKRNLEIHGKRVLGKRDDIPDIIKQYDINEVIIAIPSADGKIINQIYDLCNIDSVEVKITPGVYEIINGNVSLSQIREVRVEDLLGRKPIKLNTFEISAYLENKTVLVTGGGGSIGSELCRQIIQFNPEMLLIFDIYENNLYFLSRELKQSNINADIKPIIGSIRDLDKLHNVFAKYNPDVVFHAAAHKHVPLMENDPEEAVKNNVMGSKNVAEMADQYNVERFVLISTDKAVNPTNVMGATKRVAEMIIQSFNERSKTKFMAVRFGNVLGSEGSVIPLFKKQIAEGGPLTITHPEITRYFMTIPEASQLVVQAGGLGKGGEVFVLDMGQPVKIVDLAKDLIKLSGLTLDEDIEIKYIGLRPGEKLYEELMYTDQDINTEHERIFITNLKKVNSIKLFNYIEQLKELTRDCYAEGIIQSLIELVNTYQPNRDHLFEYNEKGDFVKPVKKQQEETAVVKEEAASKGDNL